MRVLTPEELANRTPVRRRFDELIRERGLLRKWVMESAGMTQRTLYRRMEQGDWRGNERERVAAAMGVAVTDLFPAEEEGGA